MEAKLTNELEHTFTLFACGAIFITFCLLLYSYYSVTIIIIYISLTFYEMTPTRTAL